MLLGRERIAAAVKATLGTEVPAVEAEAEMVRGRELGRAGLWVLAGERALFVTEPVRGEPEVLSWEVRAAPCAVTAGFLGPEVCWTFDGGPVRLCRLDPHDLETVEQRLFGEAAPAPSSFGTWRERLGAGVSSGTADGGATAASADAAEGATASGGAASDRAPARSREGKAQAREARRGSVGERKKAREAARERASETPLLPTTTTPGRAPAGRAMRRLVLTLVGLGAAAIAGAVAGGSVAGSAQADPAAVESTFALWRDIDSGLVDAWTPFLFYFLFAFVVLFATSRGRTLYSRSLFQVNVLLLFGMVFGTTFAGVVTSDLAPMAAARATERERGGQVETAGEQAPGNEPGPTGAESPPARSDGQAPPGSPESPAAEAAPPAEAAPATAGTAPAAGQQPESGAQDALMAALNEALEKRSRALDACAAKAPQVPRPFEVEVAVQKPGRIARVTLSGDARAPALERCLAAALKGVKLPRWDGDEVVFDVPFAEH